MSLVYVGEINGEEAWFGVTNRLPFKYDRGSWYLDINPDILINNDAQNKFSENRRRIIAGASPTECLAKALMFMDEICALAPFSDITQDLLSIITGYLAACCPWPMHPGIVANITDIIKPVIDVSRMVAATYKKHESYNGVLTYDCDVIAARSVTDGRITWHDDSDGFVINTMQMVILEAKRNQILGQI